MDDLIPFLVFIVIALINLVKFLLEKKSPGKKPSAEGEKPQEQKAAPFEDFFEDLARKLDPNEKSDAIPAWPQGDEKPDYAAEQAAYEEFQEPEDVEDYYEPAPVAEIISMPEPVVIPRRAEVAVEAVHSASLKSAMSAIPAMKSNFSAGIPSTPVMKSGNAGSINFSLKNKANLRKAILAKVVLDPPRAYDTEFKNTSL